MKNGKTPINRRRVRRSFDPTRRDFLLGMAATTGALGLGACGGGGGGSDDPLAEMPMGAPSQLPRPEDSGVDHIVQVMMENRSYDHMLGWVPGSDGRQAGQRYPNAEGELIETFRLSQDLLMDTRVVAGRIRITGMTVAACIWRTAR